MPGSFLQRDNPIDEYSTETVANILLQELPDNDYRFLYPVADPATAPSLQKIGEIAGWHNQSPLGHGINNQFGIWFAYRAVVSVVGSVSASVLTHRPSPCLTCADTPCVSSCPASAIVAGRHPDLVSCVQFRRLNESPCAQTCLARLSCPVAPQWRYSEAQLSYYYRRSLPALIRWVSPES